MFKNRKTAFQISSGSMAVRKKLPVSIMPHIKNQNKFVWINYINKEAD